MKKDILDRLAEIKLSEERQNELLARYNDITLIDIVDLALVLYDPKNEAEPESVNNVFSRVAKLVKIKLEGG